MKRVIIESPYFAEEGTNRQRNIMYARACVKDSLERGEAPIASHLLNTQPGILDDFNPSKRQQGIAAGHAWTKVADLVAVYINLGLSPGMKDGIEAAEKQGTPYEFRKLSDWPLNREALSFAKIVETCKAYVHGIPLQGF